MNLESPAENPSPVHDSDELLKDAEALLQYGTWIWNPDSAAMEWSHGMYRLLGYAHTEAEVQLDDLLNHLPLADQHEFTEQLHAAFDNKSSFNFIHSLIVDGATLRVRTKGKTTEREGRTVLLGVTQDVSQAQAVQDDAKRDRGFMDQYEIFLKFGTWQFHAGSHKLQWSVGMYNLFGYDISKEKDLQITEAIYEKHIEPEDYQMGLALRKQTEQSNNQDYFWQYRIATTNGEHKWLETYAHIARDTQGHFIGTFGITRDITRLKVYEHSLESKIKELNRSNAELEDFAYVASHDMQEPLRKLITFSERLNAKYADTLQDEGKLYLNRMVAATNNMRLLIDNLLDFSRVARTDDAFAPTDLNDVLHKTLADLEVPVEETKAIITSDTLPIVEAQHAQMMQLFTNVLSNALKFRTPDVPPQITIHCSYVPAREADKLNLERNNRYYRIEIKDNGIGFEPEYAQKIFQIFQRLHGKAEYPGSGIGLAICKKIVEYHNGLMYANGQLNEGATITIILPEKQ